MIHFDVDLWGNNSISEPNAVVGFSFVPKKRCKACRIIIDGD